MYFIKIKVMYKQTTIIKVDSHESFARSPETSILVKMLSQLEEGELCTYKDMAKVIKVSDRKLKQHLISAIKIVQRDELITFQNVKNVGYRRVSNRDISDDAISYHTMKIRNDNSRFRKKLDCVDVESLNEVQVHKYSLAHAILGVREAISTDKTQRAIAYDVSKQQQKNLQISSKSILKNIAEYY